MGVSKNNTRQTTPSGMPSARRKHLRRKVLRQELKLASAGITAEENENENANEPEVGGGGRGVRVSERLRQRGEWGFRLRRAGRYVVNVVGRYVLGGLASVGFEHDELDQLRSHARQLETALRKKQIAAAADDDVDSDTNHVDNPIADAGSNHAAQPAIGNGEGEGGGDDDGEGEGEAGVLDCPPTVPSKGGPGDGCPMRKRRCSVAALFKNEGEALQRCRTAQAEGVVRCTIGDHSDVFSGTVLVGSSEAWWGLLRLGRVF